jgi:hypothetical protein
MRHWHLLLLASGFVAAACAPDPTQLGGGDQDKAQGAAGDHAPAGGGGGAGPGHAPGLPCNVRTILGQRCQTCHGAAPAFGAPIPLVSYADLSAARGGGHVYDSVKARVHDDARPMPPSPNPRLAAAELATIDAWVAGGAPTSDEACRGEPPPPPQKQLSCKPDTFIRPASPFTMPAGSTDVYVCYGFDVTSAQKKHVIGFGPKIDNTKIVHHVSLFQADEAYSTTPQECDLMDAATWRAQGGWAPGGDPLEPPPEAGFPQQGTTHYVLQIHYNDSSGKNAGQVDGTGYDLCTTTQLRPNDADVMAFGGLDITLPPHATTEITCDYKLDMADNVHIFASLPHMHRLGKAISTYVVSGGQNVKVVDQPAFDFNAQVSYSTSAQMTSSDIARTRCVFNNDTDHTVEYGENTRDEMCFNFAFYYPRVTSSLWSWAMPAVLSTCKATTH